jgi:hypothetical protein
MSSLQTKDHQPLVSVDGRLLDSQFTQRKIILPRCHEASDLNDLVYEWPAGFARFVLEAENPDPAEWLPREVQERLELILGAGFGRFLRTN